MIYGLSHLARYGYVLAVICCLVHSAQAFESAPIAALTSESDAQPALAQTMGNLPIAFEKNQGQADSAIKFLARGLGYQVFLTAQEAVMVFTKADVAQEKTGSPVPGLATEASANDAASAVLRMRFEGANPESKVTGIEPLNYKTNYFFGADSAQQVTDIASHARVQYESIYPGIDLVYYGHQQQLEYDLLVAPNANAAQIALRFSGADSVSLAPGGDLVLRTKLGEVTYRKPVAYQDIAGERRPVNAQYHVADNGLISFRLGHYDTNKALVIDPILSYSTLLWGTKANGVAVDAAGNAYVVGTITTTDLPASTGYQTRLAGDQDAFVIKLNSTGTQVLYATYLGGRRTTSTGVAIAIDSVGNAIITGKTDAPAFPVTTGAYQTTYASGASFITKLNANGNALIYSSFVNGATIAALVLDSSGNAYLTGTATALTTTAGAFQTTIPSTSSPFVAKLDSAGSAMVYATYLGGQCSGGVWGGSTDEAKSIAVDSSGNAFITGHTCSVDFPVKNAHQTSLSGGFDAFISKLNPSGSALIYSSYLGGANYDSGNAIAVDTAGQAFVVGESQSPNFPVTASAFQPAHAFPTGQFSNAFVAKINNAGNALMYSSYLGGRACLSGDVNSCSIPLSGDIDAATAIAIDSVGHAYVAGYASSVEFPQSEAIQSIGLGSNNERTPFVTKISPDGERQIYSVVLGARAKGEMANGIGLDGNGNAYVAGFNAGAAFPFTGAVVKNAGQNFIFKLSTGNYPTNLASSTHLVLSTQPVTFTAYVQSVKTGGTVSFMNGASVLGASAMMNGKASLTVMLPAGVHQITAVYSLDGKVSPPLFQLIDSPAGYGQ